MAGIRTKVSRLRQTPVRNKEVSCSFQPVYTVLRVLPPTATVPYPLSTHLTIGPPYDVMDAGSDPSHQTPDLRHAFRSRMCGSRVFL